MTRVRLGSVSNCDSSALIDLRIYSHAINYYHDKSAVYMKVQYWNGMNKQHNA